MRNKILNHGKKKWNIKCPHCENIIEEKYFKDRLCPYTHKSGASRCVGKFKHLFAEKILKKRVYCHYYLRGAMPLIILFSLFIKFEYQYFLLTASILCGLLILSSHYYTHSKLQTNNLQLEKV